MKWLNFICFSILTFSIFGQNSENTFLITGSVFDAETHNPLPFVTVTLQDITTNEIIGDITNKKGEFELRVPKGKYNCIVESLSFKPFKISSLSVFQNYEIGLIELNQNRELLNEVEIVAKEKMVDYKFSKKVYHASKDIANVGGNAITVLENTPGARVGEDGSITIRGTNAKVLVNGKPYGGQKSNADILSLIPAGSIKNVEILTRSAKYDADGGGEILNIVLKKGVKEEFKGSVEVHGGLPDNDGVSTFINYKSEKVNIFSTLSYNHNVEIKNTKIEQIYFDNNGLAISNFDQAREDYRQNNSILFNVGSDFYLNDKNTITTSLLLSNSNKNYDSNLLLNDYQPIDDLIRTANRRANDNSDETFMEAFINYTTKFKKEGHELSFDLNYDRNTSENNTDIIETESFPNNDIKNQRYSKDEFVDTYFFQVDYTLPLKNDQKIELGHKSGFRNYENNFLATNFDPISQTNIPINGYSNKINYDENVFAFYAIYKKQLEKLSYSLELRTEITQTEIKETSENLIVKNNYTDLFPAVTLNYSFENGNALTAHYSRSIDRPAIDQLNPFNTFSDERFIRSGNPFLQPYYTNYFLLEFNQEFEKLYLNSSFYFSSSIDNFLTIIENTGEQTSEGFDIFRNYPVNNGTLNYAGLEFAATYSPTKKLRLYGLLSPYYSILSNTTDGIYDFTNFVLYGTFSLFYRLNNTLRFQVNYDYQTPQKTALTELDFINYVNFTASKDLFNNKATLTFRISDVFNTREARYTSMEANTLTNRNVVFNTRYLLSFSYRFNKASKRNANNRAKDVNRNVFELKEKLK